MRKNAYMACSIFHFLLFFLILAQLSPTFADEFSVVSHPSILRLGPGQPIEDSPGTRPGSVFTCNRVHVRGLWRLRDFKKFFHSLKLMASVSQGDSLFSLQSIDFCLHRNASLGMCICPAGHWRKLSKGSFVRSLSPFVDWYIDIRVLPNPSRFIVMRTELEFVSHRVVFLILGFCMMIMAHPLSESIAFYYGGAMTVGIILVILMVLCQGMKLLPTGRKSSLAILIYSSIVVGAWCGYWSVRKLVLTDDGHVDTDVAYFVEWAALILSGIMIFQSSLDTILSAEAVLSAVIVSSLSRHVKLKSTRQLLRRMFESFYEFFSMLQFPSRLASGVAHDYSPASGLNRFPNARFGEDDFYSTFHSVPRRHRFTKEEWKAFTRDETRKALRELVSSPDFSRWAAQHADRITLTPKEESSRTRRPHRFGCWSH